jgi:hypothetical protein
MGRNCCVMMAMIVDGNPLIVNACTFHVFFLITPLRNSFSTVAQSGWLCISSTICVQNLQLIL